MANISTARAAIAELKKSASPGDQPHWDVLSAALETIGQRLNKLEKNEEASAFAVAPAESTIRTPEQALPPGYTLDHEEADRDPRAS
jgi:hypothetical protein